MGAKIEMPISFVSAVSPAAQTRQMSSSFGVFHMTKKLNLKCARSTWSLHFETCLQTRETKAPLNHLCSICCLPL